MRSLDFVRVIERSIVLAIAGLIAGSVLVGARVETDSSAATTVYTRSWSCHAFGFQALTYGTTFGYDDGARTWGGEGDGWFICAVTLPSGAVVTKARFTIQDGTNVGSIDFCGLNRNSLSASGSRTVQGLAEVPSTGMAAQPGRVRLVDSGIQRATIDNTRYSYYLQCRFSGFEVGLALLGADIVYRISASKG